MSRQSHTPAVLDDTATAPPARPVSEDARAVRKALRALEGTATVADVSSETGLEFSRAETALKELLGVFQGHLAVGEAGDLVYSFDPRLIRRDHIPALERAGRALQAFLVTAFKVWIMVMLIVYFVLFLVLAVAMIVGVSVQGGGRSSRRGGGVPINVFNWFWAPRWRVRRPYYGRRHEERRDLQIPFYKKVFAFVFGPDDPDLSDEDRDQEVLQLVRARRGVVTVPELVELNGKPLPDAEEEMGRVMGRFRGDPKVSREGEVLYTFPDLMLSAHGRVVEDEPVPTWRKLERPKELTGNRKATDVIIGSLNGFNLIAAASAPFWLLPQVSVAMSGFVTDFFLFQMPLAFSALFFAVPAVRSIGLARENGLRWARNVRRAVIGHVYRASLDRDPRPVTVQGALREAQKFLKERRANQSEVEAALHQLASEFDADVEADADGVLAFQFPAVRTSFIAAAEGRTRLRLEERSVGQVVYDSGDTPQEETARDQLLFDRELRGALTQPRRVRHLDDYEIAEFDRMLAAARRSPRFLRRGTEVRPALPEEPDETHPST